MINNRLIKVLLISMIFCFILVGAKKVDAIATDTTIPINSIPQWVTTDILNCRNNPDWGVVSDSWLSPVDNSSATSITVTKGTKIIDLQMNDIYYRCHVNYPTKTAVNALGDVTFVDPVKNTNITTSDSFSGSYPNLDKGDNVYNLVIIKKITYTSSSPLLIGELSIPFTQRGYLKSKNDIDRCSIWVPTDFNGLPITDDTNVNTGAKNCVSANRPFSIYVTVLNSSATISTSSTSSPSSAYPGQQVTFNNNVIVSKFSNTLNDGYNYSITNSSIGGSLTGYGSTVSSTFRKYTDGSLSNSFNFTIPSNSTATKYCRTITISNNTSYATVSNPTTTACVNVSIPTITTSTTLSQSNIYLGGNVNVQGAAVTNNTNSNNTDTFNYQTKLISSPSGSKASFSTSSLIGELNSNKTFNTPIYSFTPDLPGKYCFQTIVVKVPTYAHIVNGQDMCVNVSTPTPTAKISTTSTASLTSAYPGQQVTFNNNVIVSNVSNTLDDGYNYSITNSSIGGSLTGYGSTVSSTFRKYTDGSLSNSFNFTIPSNSTATKYCRTITISNNTSYATVSNPTTTACVNVLSPPAISCSDYYSEIGDSTPIKVPYTVTNKDSSSIKVDGNSGDFSVNETITNINGTQIEYPGTINGNQSGYGSIDITSSPTYGIYNVSLGLVYGGTVISSNSCNMYVVFKPYFKVYGAGITTGSRFFSNGVCGTSKSGNIVAFNNGTNGSSTDQAIFSSGYVYNTGSQNNSKNPPNLLTFANTDIANGQWGGNFDGVGCIPDYYHNFITLGYTDKKSNLSIKGFSSGVQITSSNDIYINSNITLPIKITTNTLSDYLEYIVAYGHDIYIDPSVTEIDAVLIAEPDSNGHGGNIYTCQTNSTSSPTNIFSCTNSLTIKGSLIANTVHLQRVGMQTSSKASNSSNGCESRFMGGEQVCFSPLEWLSLPSTNSSNSSNSSNIDAIQQLPPTL